MHVQRDKGSALLTGFDMMCFKRISLFDLQKKQMQKEKGNSLEAVVLTLDVINPVRAARYENKMQTLVMDLAFPICRVTFVFLHQIKMKKSQALD